MQIEFERAKVHEVARCGAESFVQTLPPKFRLAVGGMYWCYLAVGSIDFDADGRWPVLTSDARG